MTKMIHNGVTMSLRESLSVMLEHNQIVELQ